MVIPELTNQDLQVLRNELLYQQTTDIYSSIVLIKEYAANNGHGLSNEAAQAIAATAKNPELFKEMLTSHLLFN